MSKTLVDTVRRAWERLEAWCQSYHPRLLAGLNPGASAEELKALEDVIGQPLPADLRESFSIHNGEAERTGFLSGFLFGYELFSTEDVAGEWRFWREFEDYNEEFRDNMSSIPEGAIALDYANPGWLPLTRDAGGNHLGVDLAPGPAGTRGQFINFGRDEKEKCVLAESWAEFLDGYATLLESELSVEIDPDLWFDTVRAPLGDGHCHDRLKALRREGRWPPSGKR